MNIRISEKQKILYYSPVALYTYFLSQVFSKLFSRLCLTCVEIIETRRNKKSHCFGNLLVLSIHRFFNNIHFSHMTGIVLLYTSLPNQQMHVLYIKKVNLIINLWFITSKGKHQLIYSIRARSLRPRPHVSGYFWIRPPEWKFLYMLWIRNRVDDIFFIWWRNQIEPSSLPTTISTPELFCAWRTGVEIVPTKAEQDKNFARFTTHALFPIFAEESWVLEWMRMCEQANSIWIRIRADVEIFESAKKSCGFQNTRMRVDGA